MKDKQVPDSLAQKYNECLGLRQSYVDFVITK